MKHPTVEVDRFEQLQPTFYRWLRVSAACWWPQRSLSPWRTVKTPQFSLAIWSD